MKQELMVTAKSQEEALEEAKKQTGRSSDELEVVVVEEPKHGVFGKVKEMGKYRVCYEAEDAAKEPHTQRSRQEKLEVGMAYLHSVIAAFDIGEITQEVKEDETGTYIVLSGEQVGALIGRRGETLDALQYLTSLAANRGGGEYLRILLDSGDFRSKRKETLEALARRLSQKAKKQGRNVTLEPMNPYERRIIHMIVSEEEGITSRSIGTEPHRRVVICPEGGTVRDTARRKPSREKHYDRNYEISSDVSSEPTTYSFEKEFLKDVGKEKGTYGKIDLDEPTV